GSGLSSLASGRPVQMTTECLSIPDRPTASKAASRPQDRSADAPMTPRLGFLCLRTPSFLSMPAMSTPPKPIDLAALRQEIDRIDEAMHKLLMERGDIIDRLIEVKKSQESGSAFRPMREAQMMRRLAERHK